jgi:hypothetical protein
MASLVRLAGVSPPSNWTGFRPDAATTAHGPSGFATIKRGTQPAVLGPEGVPADSSDENVPVTGFEGRVHSRD